MSELYNIDNFKNKRKVFVDKLDYAEYYIIVVEVSITKTFFLWKLEGKKRDYNQRFIHKILKLPKDKASEESRVRDS